MNYSKGISWFNDCRIPFVDEGDNNTTRKRYDTNIYINHNSKLGVGSIDDSAKQGRYPANLLCSDDVLNDGSINGGGKNSGIKKRKRKRYFDGKGDMNNEANSPDNYGDKGSNSRYYDIDKWFNKMIDEL